jgi:hypothetical protein
LGARILGLRNRSSRGLVSSADTMGELGEETLELDEEGGRAKSVEDVGRDGLVDDSVMLSGKKAGQGAMKVRGTVHEFRQGATTGAFASFVLNAKVRCRALKVPL